MEEKIKEVSKEEKIDTIIKIDYTAKELKARAYDRRIELLSLIKVRGFIRARQQAKALAVHYNVCERIIYADFQWIKGNFTPSDLFEVKIDMRIARDRVLSETLKLSEDASNFEEKIKAMGLLMEVIKRYREELEAWGEKPKIAEVQKIEIESIMTKEEREAEIKRLLKSP